MISRASLGAIALLILTALSDVAHATCRIGSSADGKSYRLCERAHEITVEKINVSQPKYDHEINQIVNHAQFENLQYVNSSISVKGYIANVAWLGFSQASGSYGVAVGAKIGERFHGEMSYYPIASTFRTAPGPVPRASLQNLQLSAFLSYDLAKFDRTSLYAGTEIAIASMGGSKILTPSSHYSTSELIMGFGSGLRYDMNTHITVDFSYRFYIGASSSRLTHGLRFALGYSI